MQNNVTYRNLRHECRDTSNARVVARHLCRVARSPIHYTRDKIRPVGATRRSPLHPRVPTNIPRPEPQSIVSTTTGIQSAITKWINGKINIGRQNSVGVQNFEPLPQRRQNKYQKIIPTSIGAIARDVKPALQNRFAQISIVTLFPFGDAIIVDCDRRGDPPVVPTPAARRTENGQWHGCCILHTCLRRRQDGRPDFRLRMSPDA